MRRLLFIALTVCAISALSYSCTSDDDSEVIDDSQTPTEPANPGGDGGTTGGGSSSTDETIDLDLNDFDIALDQTSLSETEVIPTDEAAEDYDDYIEHSDFTSEIAIVYSGASATVTGEVKGVEVTVSGGDVAVNSETKAVKYSLSGSATEGSFKIYSSKKFCLALNGVSLKNSDGAAINIQSSKSAFVVLGAGSENTLTDGTSYNTPDGEDEKATLFSEGQILFSGSGTLNVNGNKKSCIASDDYLMFRPGNIINLTGTAGNGLKANDAVTINGGVLNITVSATAAKGISCDGIVAIKGGRSTILTSGGAEYDSDENDATACSGVKSDSTFTMTGGKLFIKSTGKGGKGISGDQVVNIEGGEIRIITTGSKFTYSNDIDTSPKGIKADGDLNIKGGAIMVRTSGGEGAEGIESKAIMTFSGGVTEVSSYDDAINAASRIVFNDGKLYAFSSKNDALDSNGNMEFNGGVAICSGSSAPEGGFDCDNNTFKVTGGTLIGTGGATSTPSSASTQPVMIYNGSLSSGAYLTIADSNGTNVMAYKLSQSSSVTLVSCASLKKGSTFKLSSGATVSGGTDFCGLYTGATVSGGTSLYDVTLSSMVTSVGTSTGGGQGGGFPGGGRP